MRKFVQLLAIFGAALAVLGAAPAAANAAPTGSARPMPVAAHPAGTAAAHPNGAFGCPDGFSCYYDGLDGTNLLWTAPSCGFFNLGQLSPPINDQITSIVNFGGGAIQPYNWDGVSSFIPIGPPIPVGSGINYFGSFDNVIDAVVILC